MRKFFCIFLTIILVTSLIPVSVGAAQYPSMYMDIVGSAYAVPVGEVAKLQFTIWREYKYEKYHVELYNSQGEMIASKSGELGSSIGMYPTVKVLFDTAELGIKEGKYKVKYYMEFYTFYDWHVSPKSYTDELIVVSNKCHGNHKFEDPDIWMEPECEDTGIATYTCEKCGYFEHRDVPATGHKWSDGVCLVCDMEDPDWEDSDWEDSDWEDSDWEDSDESWPHEHSYTTTVTPATCTEAGYTTYTCDCGINFVMKDYVGAKGHNYVDGRCAQCGECDPDWENPEEPHVHSYMAEVTEPTCTEMGYTTYVCDCGDRYIDGETDALGHKWGGGKVTKEATEDAEGVRTYTCTTCCGTKTESIPKLSHSHKYTNTVTVPTCIEKGYTTHSCDCGYSYTDTEVPALGHSYVDGACIVCGDGDPNWTEPSEPEETEPEDTEPEEPEENVEILRVAGAHRYTTAFMAADEMKFTLGVGKFDAVVVASGTNFADALSGSYLAAVKEAPILLACDVEWVNQLVKDYISENLNPGGTVYILGGESAVPASFETGLEGFNLDRLAGGNRFETNLLVLEEAGVGEKPILVCTGLGFADSLSASAVKLPILLVYGDKLTVGQVELLTEVGYNGMYIIGGTGAVSAKMEEVLAGYGDVQRVAGNNRFETSVKIAETFFENPDSAVLAYAWDFPDGLCGGPLAVTMGAPLILTMEKYETQAAAYIQSNTISKTTVLGGEKLIPKSSVQTIFNTK